MPINVDVLTRLDERSARVAAEQLEQQFTRAGQDAGSAFSTAVGRHLPAGVTGHAQKAGRDAGSAFASELEGGLRSAISGAASQFGALGSIADSALSKIPIAASAAGLGIGAIAVGAVAAGKALYDLGAQWDEIADNITIRTGKMGDDLDNLTSIVKDVGANTAASFSSIGDIVAQISQSMPDLAQDNGAVRQVASDLAFLNAHGQAVDIRDLGRAFQAFGVSSDDSATALNNLYSASASTGAPMNELLSNLVKVGPAARTLGMDFNETAGLLVAFEKGGLDASGATQALNSAAKVFAASNVDLKTGLADTVTQIQGFITAGNDAAAVDLAGKVFGTRGAERFVDLIRQGKLSVDDLTNGLGTTDTSIDKVKKSTEDWSDQWTILKNRVNELAETVGGPLFDALNSALGVLNDILAAPDFGPAGKIPGALPGTPVTPQSLPGLLGGPATSNQPSTLPGLLLPSDVAAPNQAMPPGMSVPSSAPPQDINKAIDDAQKSSTAASGPKLPTAPVLPYDTSLPPALAGLPQTSQIVGAEQAWLDARHTLAEKQARVTQLEHDTAATAEDVTKARNDVIQAQQAQQQAEMRLNDAANNAYAKQTKQLEKTATDLGQIGAQLDSDFGISKGLAGIVENITKFVANLAAAPVIGALAGGQMSLGFKPGEAGYGLSSVLAGSGAFGSQYQLPPVWARDQQQSYGGYGPSALVSGAGGGGYPGDAALLAGVPSGRYAQTQAADLTKGLGDCSSAVEDLVNILDGRPTGGRQMSTGNAAEWLTSRGFLPGMGGPGDFRVGYNAGHMQATLPGGTPFNWGSDSAAANRGIGGTGADDPAFTSHYYRPVAGGGLPGISGGGGYLPLTPAQLTNPALTSPTVAGSPGQGFPLPWNLDTPAPPGAPGAAPGAPGGPTLIGGIAPPQGSGKGGISMSGGIIGAALSGASSAAGLAASGAAMGMDGGMGGAAAAAAMQIGIQEINRAIQFGSQAAGIGAAGLMETFLPFGASELAQNNWLTKIVGGLVGAGVTLPNIAGGGKKTPEGLTPEQAAQFRNQQGPTPEDVAGDPNKARQGGVGGSAGAHVNTYNTTINTNRDTISGAAKDFEWNTATMNQAPGMG